MSKDEQSKPLNLRRGIWDLSSAVCYVNSLQLKAHQRGWNLAIGGGVVGNGYSENDLDILAVPRDLTPFPDPGGHGLLALFKRIGSPDLEYAAFEIPNPQRVVHTFLPFDDRPKVEVIVFTPHADPALDWPVTG
jgi:hypothetical protein